MWLPSRRDLRRTVVRAAALGGPLLGFFVHEVGWAPALVVSAGLFAAVVAAVSLVECWAVAQGATARAVRIAGVVSGAVATVGLALSHFQYVYTTALLLEGGSPVHAVEAVEQALRTVPFRQLLPVTAYLGACFAVTVYHRLTPTEERPPALVGLLTLLTLPGFFFLGLGLWTADAVDGRLWPAPPPGPADAPPRP